MTQNQISYQNFKEQRRHNFVTESIGEKQAQAAMTSARANMVNSVGNTVNSFVSTFTRLGNYFGGLK